MIKFFKKIRYGLLEDNKTAKYFKYAIGEIILVVIGILIALSINNWNDDRKEKNRELKLIASLNEELLSISEKIRLNLENNEENLQLVEDYLDDVKQTENRKIEIVSTLDVFTQSSVSYPIMTNILSANTASTIKNDSLLKELRKLEMSYNKIKESELYLDQLWDSKMSDFLSKNNYSKSLVNYMRSKNYDDQNLIELYNNSDYKNIMALKWLLQVYWVKNQRESLLETEKVITTIKKLNKNKEA